MTLKKIINSEHSEEFGEFINEIKANVLSYLEARHKAQKERMIIIGKIAEYKNSYPQRSKEHKALTTAMSEEGWSQDIISNNLVAYRQYKDLIGGVSDWHPLAEAASVSHLVEFSRSNGTALIYDSLKYFKKYKGLPSIKAIRGYLGGFFDNKFQPRFRNKGCRSNSFSTPELTTTNTSKQPETQQPKGSALVPSQGEAFEIPVNDGLFVIHQDSTDIEHEEVQPTQNELFETVLAAIPKLNLDEIYGNEAKLSRLEQIQQNLETLSDMAKPRTSRPRYL